VNSAEPNAVALTKSGIGPVIAPVAPIDSPPPEPPSCPVPGHEHSRVVLGGRYGKPGRQRQLYVCDMPKPGSTASSHRFAAALPATPSAVDPDTDEELRAARNYQFAAQDIATGLVAVSRGVSYAEAGRQVRERAARRWGAEGSSRRHGTLVSDWVEVYAEALWQAQAPHRTDWPDTVLVGVLPLTAPARNGRPGLVFSVFTAMAHGSDGTLRIIDIRTGTGTGARHWTTFLTALRQDRPGRPHRIVGDGSPGLAKAVAAAWPDDAPAVWVDEHVMREQAQRIVRARSLDRPDRRLWQLLLRAWRSRDDWAGFVAEAHRYRIPGLERWLARHEATMSRQFAERTPGVRTSRHGLQVMLRELERRLAPRRTTFGNRARTDRLLLIMGLDLSGLARVNSWARLICDWLEQGRGRPATVQRLIVDRGGVSSLRRR
jgi:hypothetical protein